MPELTFYLMFFLLIKEHVKENFIVFLSEPMLKIHFINGYNLIKIKWIDLKFCNDITNIWNFGFMKKIQVFIWPQKRITE